MSTTLSKLVEYLSEKLHSDKCTDYKYHLDYMLLPSKYSSWWRRLEDVLKTSFVFVFRRRLQDVLIKTNMFALALRLQKTSSRRLQDVLVKTNIFVLAIRLQDVFKTSCKNVFKTSSRRLQDVLQRYLQDVFKTYHQVKLFLLTRLWEAFNTFLRRSFPKMIIYRGRDMPR